MLSWALKARWRYLALNVFVMSLQQNLVRPWLCIVHFMSEGRFRIQLSPFIGGDAFVRIFRERNLQLFEFQASDAMRK